MLWTVSFNFPYIMQMIWYLKCIKLSSIIILTDIYTTSPFEYYQSSNGTIPHSFIVLLPSDLVLKDNNYGLIMNII